MHNLPRFYKMPHLLRTPLNFIWPVFAYTISNTVLSKLLSFEIVQICSAMVSLLTTTLYYYADPPRKRYVLIISTLQLAGCWTVALLARATHFRMRDLELFIEVTS